MRSRAEKALTALALWAAEGPEAVGLPAVPGAAVRVVQADPVVPAVQGDQVVPVTAVVPAGAEISKAPQDALHEEGVSTPLLPHKITRGRRR